MALATVIPVLCMIAISRSRGENAHGFRFNNGNGVTQFGDILKPPPLPHLTNLQPVPFHGGRGQKQHANIGYQYQPPPPPPPPPNPGSNNFKFPAPFYKQYNFNFVPPPQPFTTTPHPTMFQKVSSWLFQQPQKNYDSSQVPSNVATLKKECNPCNLMPWIPVIRYDLGKNINQNVLPTYGAPSPTASPNLAPFSPQPFNLHQGVPHQTYGPPNFNQNSQVSNSLSSTYGPPSATHSFEPSSPYSVQTSSFGNPSSTFGQVSSTFGQSSSSFVPSLPYNPPSSSFGTSDSHSYGVPSSYYASPSTSAQTILGSTYGPPSSTYITQSPINHSPTFASVTSGYQDVVPNYQPPQFNNYDSFKITEPGSEQQLPKLSNPSGFRNSYGEPINGNSLDISYSVSAAEGSNKVKTEVLPNGQKPENQNSSFTIEKPSPFSFNRGRNIHTLQPVALPNLSVSPLPPIFNARPFRPLPTHAPTTSNVNIAQSVAVTEFTHSDYPPTIIQSPIIDYTLRNNNQSKAYRNIGNLYRDHSNDISSQASEDHIAATKTSNSIQDNSFETTGADFGNDIYNIPSDLRYKTKVPANHKETFADLSGVSDSEVDKYRTENNLQSIDSPLLYLKPSAPHKDFDHFLLAVSTPYTGKDYEIYDELASTIAPQLSYSSNEQSSKENSEKSNVVQYIIPYTKTESEQISNNNNNYDHDWASASEDDYQARKVPVNTEIYPTNTVTESYEPEVTTLEPEPSDNELYEPDKYNAPAILNDLYDVREPPFDIIKLQQNIDDWTEQQFSQLHRTVHKPRTNSKHPHAKQIPDEYFTTLSPPANYVTLSDDFYDHEGSDSMQHNVMETNVNATSSPPIKEYNSIHRERGKSSGERPDQEEHKPHIYTAASSFRITTTTPAPWSEVATSISPLTKEKVYVVTSKPWHDLLNTTDWHPVDQFESKRTSSLDNSVSASDNMPFKSPRFLNRPSFTSGVSGESPKSESSYEFSRNWHQRINDLQAQQSSSNATTIFPEGPTQNISTNTEEAIPDTTIAEPHEDVSNIE